MIPLQWSPTFLAPGTSFMEDNFSMGDWEGFGGGGTEGWRQESGAQVVMQAVSMERKEGGWGPRLYSIYAKIHLT